MGESGEYSDRNVWVSGVYATEAEAMVAVKEAERRRGTWEQYHEYYLKELARYKPAGFLGSWNTDQQAVAKKAIDGLFPEPPFERAERCFLEIVELGVWK